LTRMGMVTVIRLMAGSAMTLAPLACDFRGFSYDPSIHCTNEFFGIEFRSSN